MRKPAGSPPGSNPPRAILDRMRQDDIARVVAIETASFSSPWPRGAFIEEMTANPYARCVVAREAAAAEPARVTAYILYWILGDELLINNLAVDPSRRRLGLGRTLLEHALSDAVAAACRTAYLEVRPSNEAAVALYESHGFKVVRRRKGYYADTREDALVMRAALKAPETQ